MKSLLRALALFLLPVTLALAAEAPRITPADAAKQLAAGKAVLIDVREPAEWAETGVAAPAVLLPMSDFNGEQKLWRPFLAAHAGEHLILYCRSGHRAGVVGQKLATSGHAVANAGGFKDWKAAGLPTRQP